MGGGGVRVICTTIREAQHSRAKLRGGLTLRARPSQNRKPRSSAAPLKAVPCHHHAMP